jgi:uncharacterized cupin superfamily protein
MATYRMFTGPDGKATWEEIDPIALPGWTTGLDVTTLKFTRREPGEFQDWHPAPQRQFVFIVSGSLEIGFEDGSVKVFGPGDARLVEDVTGKGHTTRAGSEGPCITITVGLKDQG